jgi:hypothetical protein
MRVEPPSRMIAPVTIGMAYDRHVVALTCFLDRLETGSTPVIPIAPIRDEHGSGVRLGVENPSVESVVP